MDIVRLSPALVYVICWVTLLLIFCYSRVPERLPRQTFGRWERLLPLRSGNRRQPWITVPHRTLHFWHNQRITTLHYTTLVLYAAGNGLLFLHAEALQAVQRRAAIAAILNLALVLLGGRTMFLAEAFNLSFQVHYLVHHWLGWIAVIEAIVHAGVAVRGGMSRSGQAVCGLLTILFLLLLAVSSLLHLKRPHAVVFAAVHFILVFSSVIALLFHLWLIKPLKSSFASKLSLSAGIFLWAWGYIYRYIRSQKCRASVKPIHDTVFYRHGEPTQSVPYTGASLVTVQLPRNILIYPGAFFNVYFPRMGPRRLRGEPMMAYSWEAANAADGWTRDCQIVKKLSFLVERQPHLSTISSRSDPEVTVDGPYGQELSLHTFNTVILVAEGSGIAAVMPLATALAERKLFDYDVKKKKMATWKQGEAGLHCFDAHRDGLTRLNMIWVLRAASELNWAVEELKQLSRKDPRRTLLQVWVYLPTKYISNQAKSIIPEGHEQQWSLWPVGRNWKATLTDHLDLCLDISSGNCAVAICGCVDFRHTVSDLVLRHDRQATLFELEHQPRDLNYDKCQARINDCEISMPIINHEQTVSRLPRQAETRGQRRRINMVHIEHRQRSETAEFGTA